jgi:putative Holliday junction resolvase
MGLDVGKKRIGIAISDDLLMTATPNSVIATKGALKAISTLAEENEVTQIVVGMPLNMDGSKGEMGEYVEKFIEKLKRVTEIQITTWDERLSTSAVTKVLIEGGARRDKRKEVVDKLAASYILQGYLDSQKD